MDIHLHPLPHEKNIYAIPVPDDTAGASIHDKESTPKALIIYRKDPDELFKPGIPEPMWPLPEGTTTFICIATPENKRWDLHLRDAGLSQGTYAIIENIRQ